MGTDSATLDTMHSRLRLQQLVSQGLPVGSFTYSQGLEWAVEAGWVIDAETLRDWIENLLQTNICYLEVPVYARLRAAVSADNLASFSHWSRFLYASRETRELRAEDKQRARALVKLLPALHLSMKESWIEALESTQLSGFAFASARWQIDLWEGAQSYVWSWLENTVMSGVRLIPLGQTQGQQIILSLSDQIPSIVQKGLSLQDDDVGWSSFAQAIASSNHETQYTRLYRS